MGCGSSSNVKSSNLQYPQPIKTQEHKIADQKYQIQPSEQLNQNSHQVDKNSNEELNSKDSVENKINIEVQSKLRKSTKISYQKGELIDKGAYGSVYQGLDINTGQLLAIKTVKVNGNPEKIQREIMSLKKELQILKSLKHKNIVKYYHFELCEDMSGVDIVLEYVPGGSIRSILDRFGKFEERIVSLYTEQILQGLKYLHDHNVIHRDIKGANVLIDSNGIIKLTDFGTSKKVEVVKDNNKQKAQNDDNEVVLSRSFKGSPYWMAPEVIKRVGHSQSADIWSVGCLVLEMLAKHPPYSDISTDVRYVLRLISQGVLPNYPPNLSENCKEFLNFCLISEPKQRKTVQELLKTKFIQNPEQLEDNYQNLNNSISLLNSALQYSHINNGQNENEINPVVIPIQQKIQKHLQKEYERQNSIAYKQQIYNSINQKDQSQSKSNLEGSKIKYEIENKNAQQKNQLQISKNQSQNIKIPYQDNQQKIEHDRQIDSQIARKNREIYLEKQRQLEEERMKKQNAWEDDLKKELEMIKMQRKMKEQQV